MTSVIFHLPPHSILIEHWRGDIAPCNTPVNEPVVGLTDRFTDMRDVRNKLEGRVNETRVQGSGQRTKAICF